MALDPNIVSEPTTVFSFSQDDIEYVVSTDANEFTIFEIEADIYIKPDFGTSGFDSSNLVFTERKTKSETGREFNFSKPIDTYFKNIFEQIEADGSQTVQQTQYYAYVRIDFKSIDVLGDQTGNTVTRYINCLFGNTEINTKYIYEYIAQYGAFLTFQPDNTIVTFNTPFHFSWYNRLAGDFKVVVQITKLDNIKEIHDIYNFSAEHGTYHFGFQYNQVKTLVGGVDFKEVGFFIRTTGDVNRSTIRNFKLINTKDFSRSIVFENSLGGFDCIPTHGKTAQTLSFERTLNEFEEFIRNTETENIRSYVVNSGFFNYASADANLFASYVSQELLRSRNIYLLGKSNISEVRATNSEVQDYFDADFAPFFEIELTEIRKLKGFQQPTVILPPTGSEPESYFEEGFIEDDYFESI